MREVALDGEVDDVRAVAARFPGEPYAAIAMAAWLMPHDREEARSWLMRPEVQRTHDGFDIAQAASLLIGIGELDLAEKWLARARAAARPDSASIVEDIATRTEGWIASARGDLVEAERKLRLSLERNPREAFATGDLIWFLDNLGRVEEALALLESGGPVDDPEHLHRIRERTLDRHPEFRAAKPSP